MAPAGRGEVGRGREKAGRGIVDLGGPGGDVADQAAGEEHLAVRKESGGVVGPGGSQALGPGTRREGERAGRVEKRHRAAEDVADIGNELLAAGDQNLAVRQEGRGMGPAGIPREPGTASKVPVPGS